MRVVDDKSTRREVLCERKLGILDGFDYFLHELGWGCSVEMSDGWVERCPYREDGLVDEHIAQVFEDSVHHLVPRIVPVWN